MLNIKTGDTVNWVWKLPDYVSGKGYRVFQVATSSSDDYDGDGFTSGSSRTAKGKTYLYTRNYGNTILQGFLITYSFKKSKCMQVQ